VQRHGKTAYSSLLNFKTVKEKMRHITEVEKRLVNVVEIGSGTGAGANELTWIHPSVNYTAVDMQARGASTCKALHASAEGRFVATPSAPGSSNPATFSADTRLTCLHANGQKLKDYLPDNFADIVLISETHIADVIPLDQETQNVLLQVKRLLRPGGLFVWGNAIPTSIWGNAFYFLRDMGMKREEVYDVTDNAVAARDEDFSRVEHWYEQARKTYYGLNFFSRCNHAVNRLFLNFCRHPGTALYKRMLSGSNVTEPAPGDGDWCEELDVPTSLCKDARIDSYVQMCYSLPE
jgi:SAM-dependent methyltransferase